MGREFREHGVVSGGDLTTEACTTKLAYLFARTSDSALVGRLLTTSIRGEISSSPDSAGQAYFSNRNLNSPLSLDIGELSRML